MSRENVSLVRDLYELLPSLRDPDPDAVDRLFRDYVDARFELHLPPDYPEGGQVLQGREGMDAFAAVLQETWSEWRFVPERYLDTDNRVLVFAPTRRCRPRERRSDRAGDQPHLDHSQRPVDVHVRLPGPLGSPRSRGAAGVARSSRP